MFLVDLRGADQHGMTLAPHPQHGEPRNQRAVLRQLRDSRRESRSARRAGVPLHPRRHERRADSHRGRVHRRRLLVHRQIAAIRLRTHGVRPPDRPEPGRAVSDRACVRERSGRRPHALRGRATCTTRGSPAARKQTWRNSSRPMRAGKRRTPACRRSAASASRPNTTSSASSARRASIRSRRFPRT